MSAKRPKFLTAAWRHLVMLNFEIDPAILSRRVPPGTELDLWNGRAYVSLIGFRFLQTRLLGIPIPFHRDFSEVNLRFYVRRQTASSWKRGVVFIREIVPVPAVTFVARWVYNENYITLPMRHQIDLPLDTEDRPGSVGYSWKWKGCWSNIAADVLGQPQPLSSGSEEEFITEHYWGYAIQRDGGTMEYEVEHPPWRVWRATSSRFECDVETLYGPEFVEALSKPPNSALVADGSEIVIRGGTRLA
jgi:uncharacterized protein YqjF (DUF2071 family)